MRSARGQNYSQPTSTPFGGPAGGQLQETCFARLDGGSYPDTGLGTGGYKCGGAAEQCM